MGFLQHCNFLFPPPRVGGPCFRPAAPKEKTVELVGSLFIISLFYANQKVKLKFERVSLPADDLNLLLEFTTVFAHKPDLPQDGL